MDSSAGKLGQAFAALLALLALALVLVLTLYAGAAHAATPVAISPLYGTHDASPYTQISFLGVAASEITDVSVRGSRTGTHGGHLRAYATAPGASFVVDGQFSQGEGGEASALVGPKGHQRRVSTYFTVARLAPYQVEKGESVQLKGRGTEQS